MSNLTHSIFASFNSLDLSTDHPNTMTPTIVQEQLPSIASALWLIGLFDKVLLTYEAFQDFVPPERHETSMVEGFTILIKYSKCINPETKTVKKNSFFFIMLCSRYSRGQS